MFTFPINIKVKQCTGLDRPWGFQEVQDPRFQDSLHMKMARLSVLRTGCLYPQKIFLIIIFVRGWVDTRVIVRPEISTWYKPCITRRRYNFHSCFIFFQHWICDHILFHYLSIVYIILHGTVDVRLFSATFFSPKVSMHVAGVLLVNTLCSTWNISDMHRHAATRHNKQLGERLTLLTKMTQVSVVSPSV